MASHSSDEVKQLRTEVESLKDLLRILQQSQQQQLQILQTFLSSPTATDLSSSLHEVPKQPQLTEMKKDAKTAEAIDEETKVWVHLGSEEDQLKKEIEIAREDFFCKGIQDRDQALRHLLRDNWFNDEEESFDKFLLAAGPNSTQRPVKVRDFYDQDCRNFLLFKVDNDEDLWKLLS
ncbi:hypothetical protein BDD12DRAFT_421832, partial [Trichophaea hybrida]